MSVFGRSYGRRITGEVFLHGKPVDTSTVGKAVEHGIAYATEDRKTYGLNLIDHIKHNITLANLGGVSRHGVIDDMRELDVANDYRGRTNIRSSSVYQMTGNLSGGNQQKVVLSQMAVRQSGRADPRRADARHRRRRQVRNLHDHRSARRRG